MFSLTNINRPIQLVIMIITLSLTSCVGTISDKNAKDSKIQSSGTGSAAASFEGLQKANPISHDKIELSFMPASGDPSVLTYEIYVNNSPIPIRIGGASSGNKCGRVLYICSDRINSTDTL